MNNIVESAFVDELEKIAFHGIGRGVKRGATAFMRELKGGVAESKVKGLERKLERLRGEVAKTESAIPPKNKKPFDWRPWAVGGGGMLAGSTLAYGLNQKNEAGY